MNSHDAIDALGDIEDSLDEILAVSLLLDEGQAVMAREAKARVGQIQRELIEFNLSEDDAEAERLSDEFFDAQDGCPNDD